MYDWIKNNAKSLNNSCSRYISKINGISTIFPHFKYYICRESCWFLDVVPTMQEQVANNHCVREESNNGDNSNNRVEFVFTLHNGRTSWSAFQCEGMWQNQYESGGANWRTCPERLLLTHLRHGHKRYITSP